MADIANIGFGADTSALADAKAKMEGLVPAAGRAERAAEKLNKMLETGARSATLSARADLQKANAVLSAARASETASKEDIASAAAAQKKAKAVYDVARASEAQVRASNAAAAAANAEAAALDKAALAAKRRDGLSVVSRPTAQNDNPFVKVEQQAGAMKANVGNIAAQFQDIGVTAAMGMNPLLIALQQGTQLSAVFAQTGGNALRTIGAAFMSVFSVTSILTIGIVALGAAVIQLFTDWISKGSEANLSIQEQTNLVRGLQEAWGTGIPAIDNYLAKIDEAKQKTDALAATKILTEDTIAPSVALVEDLNTKYAEVSLNLEAIGAKKTLVDDLNSTFQNLRDRVAEGKSTQEDFNAVLDAANAASSTGAQGIEGFIETVKSLMKVALAATSVVNGLNGAIGAAQNKALNDPKNWRSGMNRFANPDGGPIQSSNPDFVNLPDNGPVPAGRGTPELSGFPWEDFGKSGGRGGGKSKGAGGGGGAAKADPFAEIVKGAEQRLATLQTERDAIGLNEEATAKLKKETELLNQAKQKDIALSPEQRAQLIGLASDMAKLEAETKQAKAALDFSRETTKGFVMDLKNGLQQGKSLWESFTNAVTNLANKLIDRGLNAIIDKMFEMNSTMSKGGGAGGGGILSWFTSLFTGGGGGGDPWAGLRMAKGGAFPGGISGHSGTIVKSPTLFAFAKGTGLMGEAGPEAIMPLKRGPDGSLGVQMHSGNSRQSGPVNVSPVINNNYTLSGAISGEQITREIRAAADQTTEQVRKSIPEYLQTYQRDGVMN